MNSRDIIFGPGDKLRWLEAVAFSADATNFHSRLAIALSNRIDKYEGTATISQEWLAAKIGATDRGVRKAIKRMEVAGLLVAARVPNGRGAATVYRPLTPLKETRKGVSSITRNGGSSETRNNEAGNLEPRNTKPGMTVPPVPKSLPKTLQTAAIPIVQSCDPNEITWQSVKEKMKASLGADVVSAWFDPLRVHEITETEVVMTAPNEFCKHFIEQHLLEQRLIAGWQRVLPNVTSVRLVVATGRAAD